MQPKVYLVGHTAVLEDGLNQFLRDTGNEAFAEQIADARELGLSDGEILCSFYAKLCYESLTEGKNDNIAKTRSVWNNLKATMDMAHGSVFRHANLNFVAANCSRVFTHEAVRHAAGTAHSQTSGRYVRGENLDVVFDPILEPIREECEEMRAYTEQWYRRAVDAIGLPAETDFARKKKVTSALRRFLPNGISNKLGFTHNIQALRHIVMMRTAEAAEWEIRCVYAQVYELTCGKYPMLYHGAKTRVVDGVLEVSGMRTQPYER